jgi:UPF0271 protein
MHTIDLNCDMGEGAGNDEAIIPYISSANIACGFHAGDDATMQKSVELALKFDVAIGAHPGFADKANFGRLEMHLPLAEVYDLITEQVYRLQTITHRFGALLHHVKPHGALYNMAANDKTLAETIAKAIKDVDENLVLYGLYNSFLITAAQAEGLKTAAEVFADRRYNGDGTLVHRKIPGAVIEDEALAIGQVLGMVLHNRVTTIGGDTITACPETVCLHGDGLHAAAFAKTINNILITNNIAIQKP